MRELDEDLKEPLYLSGMAGLIGYTTEGERMAVELKRLTGNADHLSWWFCDGDTYE